MADKKASAASIAIISIISRSPKYGWASIMKLKDYMLLSISLYAAKIWALQNMSDIENTHMRFMIRLLFLPRFTPGYLIRLETGALNTHAVILRRALNWWYKTVRQDDNRVTKAC